MKAQAISLLRSNSRNWWYHAQLRKDKRHAEARTLEIKDTRRQITYLREAYLLTATDAGVMVYLPDSSVSGHSYKHLDLYLTWAPNVPFVDKTTVPEDKQVKYILGSPGVSQKGSEYSLNVGQYLALWEKLGATVHWGNIQNPENFRKDTRVLRELLRLKAA